MQISRSPHPPSADLEFTTSFYSASVQFDIQSSDSTEAAQALLENVAYDVVGFAVLLSSFVLLCCSMHQRWKVLNAAYQRRKPAEHPSPCTRCSYFSANRYLPCAVNPVTALTVAAIDCRDFQPRQSPASGH